MAEEVLALMHCIGRPTPERRAVVAKAYVEARNAGKGDGQAAVIALALLTDAERRTADAHPLDGLSKPARPPSRATG